LLCATLIEHHLDQRPTIMLHRSSHGSHADALPTGKLQQLRANSAKLAAQIGFTPPEWRS
jgi:hypothetical protein